MQIYGEPFGDDDSFIVAEIGAQGQLTFWICNPPVSLIIQGKENLDKIIVALQEIKADIPE